ncbi:MAG TPA: Ig-like domain-containing protein, partial [Terriglobales bacterium]|nr:Ig-like domain-containing protein [Terriglobales bacterium]
MNQRWAARVTVGVGMMLFLLLAAATAPPSVEAQLNVTGQWSTLPYNVPINPIHVALLYNGKVLIVAGTENDPSSTINKYAVWDPAAGTFSQGTTPWDLFCNGMSFLPDGRVFLTGGNLAYETDGPNPEPFKGLKTTTIFDPVTEKFIQVEDMAKGRWYPTNVALADGGQLTFSGLDEHGVMNDTVEIYDVGGGWTGPYAPSPVVPKWYPWLHLLSNGKVVMTGPDAPTRTFNPATGVWSGVMATTNFNETRTYGSSVLLPLHPDTGYAGKIVIFGGKSGGATNTVELLDTSVFPESWVSMPPMSAGRITMNAVLMPNGKILVVGGSGQFNTPATAVYSAETFDPVAQTWTPSGTMAFHRLYHSTALLLPDATVWVAGSNPGEGVWTPQMEIYKPPYLFTSTGAPAPRPTITSLPAKVGYGQAFTINTPDAAAISQVVLMRPGSNTHSFDMEQRMLYTYFTKGTGTLTVTAPSSANGAPPGYYMVFLINASGVPSVAKFVHLSATPTNQPPTATITNPSTSTVSIAAGQPVTFAGTAADPDGTIALYQWNFPGGSPVKSTVQNPGAVTFAAPGTYIASLTVVDNQGANNVSPPTVTINVGGSPALTAAITSPANGATVMNTVTVNMSAGNAQGSPTQFVLKLDNGATLSSQSVATGSTATYAWNTTTTTNGAHTLNLTVTDGAGRTATAVVSVTVNNGGTPPPGPAPTVSITSPANNVWIGNSVNIKASASSSAPLVNLKYYGNGGVFATVPCSGTTCTGDIWWVTGPLPNAKYMVQVVATDSAGGCTVSAAVALNKDATSPTVASGASCPSAPLTASITAPANGATVSGTVTVTMSAGNIQGTPTQFVLKLDDGATLSSQSVPSGSTATYAWNSTTTTNGSHTLNLTVTDGAGRTATSVITVTVSNAAPPPPPPPLGAAITAPASGATVSGSTVTVNMSATNAQGTPNQFVLKLDNGATLSTQSVAGSTATYTWNTTTTTNGSHTLDLTVTDGAGRTATASITVTVSNAAPPPPPPLSAAITAPASGATVSGSAVTVSMSATNAQGTPTQFVLKLDNGATLSTQSVAGSTASYTWDTTTTTNGSHTLDLTVTDGAGRTAAASISVTVSNGTTPTPPTVSITSPANNVWIGNSVNIKATASSTGSPLSTLKFYGNGGVFATVTCTTTTCSGDLWWKTGGLPAAKYEVQVVATTAEG